MPILAFDGGESAGQPPEDKTPKSGVIALDLPESSYGRVLADVPEKVGLSFIQAGAGATRALSDLLGLDTLGELSGDIARNAGGAADTLTPGEMTYGQKVLSGAAESAGQMLPALAALATGGAALVPAGIALAAGQQGGQRYSELRDAGFGGGRAGFHAAIDALAEGLGEFVSLPVLAAAGRPFLNKLVHFAARDLVGEEFTTVMEQGNAMLSDKPDMTWGEFLQGMQMTALVTPLAAGMQVAAGHGAQRIRAALAPREQAAPDFKTPKQQHPAPATEEIPPAIPPALPMDAPEPATLIATPPEKPAVTAASPEDSFVMPTDAWSVMDTPIGKVYTGRSTNTTIQKDGPGWVVISPAGEAVGGVHPSLEAAHKTAENYGFTLPEDQIPQGWDRTIDGTFTYELETGEQFSITGKPGDWQLRDPTGSVHRSNDSSSIAMAAKGFAPYISDHFGGLPSDRLTMAGFRQTQDDEWEHDSGWRIRKVDGITSFVVIPPVGGRQMTFADLDSAIGHVQRALESGRGATTPKRIPGPNDASFADAMETTPEEMQHTNSFDPRLYTGFKIFKNGGLQQLDVSRLPDGRFKINVLGPPNGDGPVFSGSQPVMSSETFDDTHATLTALTHMTGEDIRLKPDLLKMLYSEHVLSKFQTDPNAILDVSPSVMAYFGADSLSQISAGAAKQTGQLGFTPNPQTEGRGTASNQAQDPKLGYDLTTASGKRIPTKNARISDVNSMVPPGVYLQAGLEKFPFSAKVAGFIERLRSVFLPNQRIIIEPGHMLNNLLQGPGTGSSARLRGNVSTITLNRMGLNSTMSQVDFGRIMLAAAHEFGHLVIYEHYYKATPQTRAKLMASYYNYVSDTKRDTTLLRYLAEHNFGLRGEDRAARGFDATIGVLGQDKGGAFAKYVMSFTEYLADQASAYFTYNEGITNSDTETRGFFRSLLDSLQAIWAKLNTHFKVDTVYHEWLSSLAGPGYKAGSTGRPPPGTGPPVMPLPVMPKKRSTPVTSRPQAEALLKKAGDLMDALHRAGAPKEEVDALSPTELIADINWDAAKALADKYGIPRTIWGERYAAREVDDTLALREQLFSLSTKMAERGDREEIAKTSAAIKGFNWILQRTMTAVQLRKRFGDTIPGVKAFVDSLEKMFAYRSRWKERADNRIKQMRGISHGERTKVFDLILDEDKSGEFAAKLDRDIAGKRTFTITEEAIKKYKLTEQGVALYRSIREDFDAALEELEFQADSELHRLYSPGEGLTKALAELHDGFAEMKARPYVPHTRFGDHTVTVRTPEGAVREFYQFESEREAKSEEKRLRAEYGKSAVVSRGKMTEVQRLMAGLPPQLINAMKAHLGLSPEQIGKFEDLLKDMTNGASFVRRFKRRKNIEGWADDAEQLPRAYADYMSRFANHVSRLKYNHVLSEATGAVRSQALNDSKMGVNTVELNDLASWLGKLQDYINQPGVEYANARAAATIWYLGLNTKSALVNSTSVPMVTLPFLSKRWGWARAFDSVSQAYKDIARQYVKVNALTPDERKMLQSLREAGRIDASFASELAGLREGGRLSDQTALSKPAAAFFGVKYYAMWLFQKVEVINREVTALAAYRLSRTNRSFAEDDPHGFDQKAAEYASRSVQDTQSENAQWNRSEFMRGRKSILTMFMSYQQNIIYQMLGGDQSWMRLLAAQLVMAGLMGIPFAQDLDELIKAFARKVFGSDMNVEKAIRAMLKDTMVNADWFLKGAAHDIGGIDLSGSLSQGRVIPGVDALAMEGGFADRLANAAGDVGGAGFSILLTAMKTAASNDPATWKKWSRMMPEFARSIVEGGEMLSGAARDGKGNKIAETSTGDAFMRGLGFQVSNVSEERAKRFAQRDTAQYWLTRRAYVLALWEKAVEDRNGDWRDKARDALRDFNQEAPDRALRITSDQLRESMKRRAVGQARVERGLGPSKTTQETYRRVGETYQ